MAIFEMNAKVMLLFVMTMTTSCCQYPISIVPQELVGNSTALPIKDADTFMTWETLVGRMGMAGTNVMRISDVTSAVVIGYRPSGLRYIPMAVLTARRDKEDKRPRIGDQGVHIVSPRALRYLCDLSSRKQVGRGPWDVEKWWVAFCSSNDVLGKKLLSREDIDAMPDVPRRSELNNSLDHDLLRKEVLAPLVQAKGSALKAINKD